MLVLKRRKGESIQVDSTEIRVLEIRPGAVKLGFSGPGQVQRTELLEPIPSVPSFVPLDVDPEIGI